MKARGLSRRAVLGAALTPALLAGCGGSGNQLKIGVTGLKANRSVDPLTVRPIKGVNNLIDSASDLDGIDVRAIDINGGSANASNAKIQTLLLSGGVDIIQSSTVWPFYKQGLLRDLTDYYERDGWQRHYIPALFRPPMERIMYPPWVPHPTTYISAPGSLDTFSLAYDKQIFDDFGVPPLPTVPTIDEVLEAGRKLTGKNPRTGKDNYGLYYDPRGQAHIILYYLGHGVDFGSVDPKHPAKIRFDTPAVKAGIKGMIAMAKYCPPGFEIGQGAENWGTADNTVAINLVVAPAQMLTPILNKLTDRFVVTEGIRDRDNHTFFVSATEFAIAKKCRRPDVAWKIVKFLCGPAGQRFAYENYNALPSWKSQDWVDPKEMPYAKPFLAAANAGRNAFFPEFMFRTFRPWVAAIVSKAVNGDSYDLDGGLADMQRKAEQWATEQ